MNAGWGDTLIVIVGLLDAAVKESRDRVIRALIDSGYGFTFGRTTVNLAPADVKKEGPSFDLPIALGMLAASEQIETDLLETTKIHSIVGLIEPGQALITRRPFRAPHHTASDAGLLGGNINPTPGGMSLAHHGVLFLGELPEFKRSVLETMRQPLEEGKHCVLDEATRYLPPARHDRQWPERPGA